MTVDVGSSIGRYELEALVGQGGMGRVFRAHDPRLGRRVALKVLTANYDDDGIGTGAASRMLREARAAAAFNHPNVVAIYDVGEEGGTPFIAMELVDGAPLRDFVGDASVPLEQKVGWLLDVARGLGAAHRAGLVHRDIKPDNVLVTRDGTAKILDFGIARRTEGHPVDVHAPTSAPNFSVVTAEGVVVGTPQYMSPEQLRGDALDGRCDQFAWGVTAFEVLSGRLPWRFATGVQLVAALLEANAPRLDEMISGLDPRMAAAVDRALQGQRDARFSTMEELVAFVTGTSGNVALPPSRRLVGSGPAAFARTELAPTAPPVVRASRSVLASAAVLVGVVAIAIPFAVVRSRQRAPSIVASTSGSSAIAAASTSTSASASGPASGRAPVGAAALAAYQAATQSFRDGDSPSWQRNLEIVLENDPGFGAAYLWLGHLWAGSDDARARGYYSKAVQYRGSLGEVEAALLEAMEPRFREPPDRAERLLRMERLAARYPRETTVQYMVGLAYLSVYRYADATAAFDRALALDGHFSLAYENQVFIAQYQGDLSRAQSFVDRCVAACPGSVDCRKKRVEFDNLRGDCHAMMTDARHMIAGDATTSMTYELLADAMAAVDEPHDAVVAMLERASEAESLRRPFFAHARAVAAASYYGDLATALGENAAESATIAGHANESPVDVDLERLELLAETGDAAGLRALAVSLRGRIGAWVGPEAPATMTLSGYERRAGIITAEELRARRAQWMQAREETRKKDGSKREAFWDWDVAYGPTVATADDARDAAEALDRYGPIPAGARIDPPASADIGIVYAMAGRYADAIAPLRFAATSCTGLTWAVRAMGVHYWLGVALEKTGDVEGARAAYRKVLARWKDARPRAVTAEAAQAALKRLRG